MKALVFAILLISLVGTFARVHKTRARRENHDTAHKIADAVAVLDDLQSLSENEHLNEKYWRAFYDAYDLDHNGLTKEEFHEGIDAWTQRNGFGHQSKPGTDAIWDQLNTDGNEYLSFEEAQVGSQSIFAWYKLITQNVLRGYANELAYELAVTRCQDTKQSVAGFQTFPSVSDNIGASWDTDGDGYLNLDEVKEGNAVYMDLLFLEHLNEEEEDAIFNNLDEDGDGYLNPDQAGEYLRAYLDAVVDHACEDHINGANYPDGADETGETDDSDEVDE